MAQYPTVSILITSPSSSFASTAAQKIAAENEQVTAQVYDLNHFPAIRDKYQVMSVPCLIVGDGETISFGKKNIRQLLELLKQ